MECRNAIVVKEEKKSMLWKVNQKSLNENNQTLKTKSENIKK